MCVSKQNGQGVCIACCVIDSLNFQYQDQSTQAQRDEETRMKGKLRRKKQQDEGKKDDNGASASIPPYLTDLIQPPQAINRKVKGMHK